MFVFRFMHRPMRKNCSLTNWRICHTINSTDHFSQTRLESYIYGIVSPESTIKCVAESHILLLLEIVASVLRFNLGTLQGARGAERRSGREPEGNTEK